MSQGGWFVQLTVACADMDRFLNLCLRDGIMLEEIEYLDDVTVALKIKWIHYKALCVIANNVSADISITGKFGFVWTLLFLLKRPCLLAGIALLVFMNGWLPTRVLFIEVDGNQYLSSQYILEAAEDCGIVFGTSRGYVRSEKVKNALLEKIPQLQWAGINTSGCVATISVKERPKITDQVSNLTYGNIVAATDGVIVECTVEKGEMVCRIGQAVRTGQVLVSGYRDNGLSIIATRPIAEIYAMTVRDCETISPILSYLRTAVLRKEVNYYLQVGEKYIKINKSSGIYDTTCVKIVEKKNMSLPGGFCWPLALVKQTCIYYGLTEPSDALSVEYDWMEKTQQNYLLDIMSAGRVLSYACSGIQHDGYYSMQGQYRCLEMIGQFKQEEIIE